MFFKLAIPDDFTNDHIFVLSNQNIIDPLCVIAHINKLNLEFGHFLRVPGIQNLGQQDTQILKTLYLYHWMRCIFESPNSEFLITPWDDPTRTQNVLENRQKTGESTPVRYTLSCPVPVRERFGVVIECPTLESTITLYAALVSNFRNIQSEPSRFLTKLHHLDHSQKFKLWNEVIPRQD